jgi:HD-GYP domain-containing protein (c-di-GMP phosphodiesterase class II)
MTVSYEEALEELEDRAGTHFDPDVVAALCEVVGESIDGNGKGL